MGSAHPPSADERSRLMAGAGGFPTARRRYGGGLATQGKQDACQHEVSG